MSETDYIRNTLGNAELLAQLAEEATELKRMEAKRTRWAKRLREGGATA